MHSRRTRPDGEEYSLHEQMVDKREEGHDLQRSDWTRHITVRNQCSFKKVLL